MTFTQLFNVFRESIREFGQDKVPRLAAALAYFALFSLAPILVIGILVGVVGRDRRSEERDENFPLSSLGRGQAAVRA